MSTLIGRGLIGTGSLVRLALRLDRVRLPIWVLAIAGLATSFVSSLDALYPTEQARDQIATGIGRNPAMLAIYGQVHDASVGGLVTWRLGIIGAVLVALMSIQTVIRHTRAEEETGRLELIGATVVGRHASLVAALIVVVGTNLVLALLIALGMASQGLPVAGSFVVGLSLGFGGIMFAGFAALAAQLTENARTATGISASFLGVTFLLRALGDSAGPAGPGWLTWLSPMGWILETRAFAGDHWWVLGLLIVLAVLLFAVAFTLVSRRDIGAGLIAPRPGPATAAPSLRSPLALAWRLHRGSLIGWGIGFAIAGAAFGGVVNSASDLVAGSEQTKEVFAQLGGAGGLVDAFLGTIMGMVGIVAAVYAVQATLRLRSEETGYRAEPLLATPVSRIRWAVSHLAFATAGSAVLLLAAGVGAGLSYGISVDDVGGQLPRLIVSALVQLPAILVVAAIAVVLFGFVPSLMIASWGALTAFLLLGQLGPLLRLDQWAMDISPFTHVPKVPAAAVTATPLLWLTGVAVALAVAGLAGFRRRDIG